MMAIGLCCSSMRAMEPVKRIYAFGDSWSDTGRGVVACNGPTAVAYLAQRLGLEMVPGNAKDIAGKSLNFAISGARTGGTYKKASGEVQAGMMDEVAEFTRLVQSGKVTFDPATTVFFLAGGINDSEQPMEDTVENLESELQTLYGLGGRRFLLAVLPEKVPALNGTGVRLDPALRKIPDAMRAKLVRARIELSGWGRFFDEVWERPAVYGITNTTEPCAAWPWEAGGKEQKPCASPETHFYYYPYHPSTAVAKVVGDRMYDEMMGELPTVGLAACNPSNGQDAP
jgi:phospholipase/lecithinase/hemolysin